MVPTKGLGQRTVQLIPHFRSVQISGLTYPTRQVTISSEVSGRCLQIYHDVGEDVSNGSQFAQIDPTFVKLELEGNNLARQQTRRKLQQDRKTLQRFTALREKESTTQAEYDEVLLAVDLTEIRLKELENQQARLAETMARHTIKAPSGWTVIERFVEPGEFISIGQKIATLGNFNVLLVRMALTFNELEQLKRQDVLYLSVPDLAKRVEVALSQVSPSVDPVTRKIPIELIIHQDQVIANPKLRGGMRTLLELVISNDQDGYQVPSTALISSYGAHWLVKADGTRQQVVLLDVLEDGYLSVVAGTGLQGGMEFLANPQTLP